MTKTLTPLHATSHGTFAFTHGGVEIVDPLTSECGRFEYDPTDPATESVPQGYGFWVEGTGGGCTAWKREFRIGDKPVYMLITELDDPCHEIAVGQPLGVGVYTDDGDTVAYWTQERGVSRKTGMPWAPKGLTYELHSFYHRMLAAATPDATADATADAPVVDLGKHEAALCALWADWCKAEGLQCCSADDMPHGALTAEQQQFVSSFVVLWGRCIGA